MRDVAMQSMQSKPLLRIKEIKSSGQTLTKSGERITPCLVELILFMNQIDNLLMQHDEIN